MRFLFSKNQYSYRDSKFPQVSTCNQMVTSEIREEFHACFVQIQIISRAFWLPVDIMDDELHSQSLVLDKFITLIIDWELRALKTLDLKLCLKFRNDVLFRVCRFSKASFNARDIFIHNILKLRRHLFTEMCGRFPFHMWNYKLMLKFRARIKE